MDHQSSHACRPFRHSAAAFGFWSTKVLLTAAERIQTDTLSWTMRPDGLFMRRSLPGFCDEIAAER